MEEEYSVANPLNREPPVKELITRFITEDNGYDRNHGPIPHIDVSKHNVRVDGVVNEVLNLSISQLKNEFVSYEVVCALQCAGNRRHTMRTKLKEVDGIDWGDGAVMNCRWKGPRLRDVLNRAGITVTDHSNAHVAFGCFATPCQDDDWYGGSIELQRAMRGEADVLLALEMNGKPLPVKHGYPVRVIAPGIAGARWVKWLDRITVQLEESNNFYQKYDYKVLPPEVTDKEMAEKFWDLVPAVQDTPINSVIVIPQDGDTIWLSPQGTTEVRGYALPQGDQGPITQVEVSVDGGSSWSKADLINDSEAQSKWCWVLWKATVKMSAGVTGRILCRATDAGGNSQPAQPQWNLRGVNYNGYGESRDLRVVEQVTA